MMIIIGFIAISLTPYQGLKPFRGCGSGSWGSDCNFTYSLLGIETGELDATTIMQPDIAISLTPYQGLKHNVTLVPYMRWLLNCNFTYSLLGIET